jgi:hypothetical protein
MFILIQELFDEERGGEMMLKLASRTSCAAVG